MPDYACTVTDSGAVFDELLAKAGTAVQPDDIGSVAALDIPPSDGNPYALVNGAWVDITNYLVGFGE